MSGKRPSARLLLTSTAIQDLVAIEEFSIAQWGKSVAADNLADLEQALARIQANPELLRPEVGFHPQLSFYRVNKHFLVCERQSKTIFLLTAIHASRDIPSRLTELAPTLAAEAELLERQLRQSGERRKQSPS